MLLSHGNSSREDALRVIEAGVRKSDPFYNMRELVRRDGYRLEIGGRDFEATDDPNSGDIIYDVRQFRHIYVVGAGKGVQRLARALEETLGEYLTGGIVICKHGDEPMLEKIEACYGSHPTPDENCVAGSRKILELARRVEADDLVFTLIANGGSSLMTLPLDGIDLEDVVALTQSMQIERGVETVLLNKVRNHVDQLKGGKLARAFSKATAVHIAAADLDTANPGPTQDYANLVARNCWLHNMPDGSTFADARQVLHDYGVWEQCAGSVRRALLEARPEEETVKYSEYRTFHARMFGVMPRNRGILPAAAEKAGELGYHVYRLADALNAEAFAAAEVVAAIACCAEKGESSFSLPAALLLSGEKIVTVGSAGGVGGRNQEFAVAFARKIAGHDRIICASVDTDGTDGPGGYEEEGAPACFAGGIVDGASIAEMRAAGIDVDTAIRTHATSAALWRSGNAINMTQGISLNDLTVILVEKNNPTSGLP